MKSSAFRIAVLLTCHNRREMTVSCLRALREQASSTLDFRFSMLDGKAIQHSTSTIQNQKTSIHIEVFLVDDGCTDGTADAVLEIWPEATIIRGDGNLYWCGGMRAAWTAAAKTDPEYYLLLNDDTLIAADAVSELLALAHGPHAEIISVAPIADPDTGDIVCGGHLGHSPRPMIPTGHPALCDTMNANCALITSAVFQKIGMFHHIYTHAMGDFDYGFLASRNRIRIVQAGKVLGTSKINSTARTWLDRSLTRRDRFSLLWKSPKGLPFWEWITYSRRNMGWIWPYRCISPALRILVGR